MADVLLRKGDIELDRKDLDGAHILFDDIPDRNILVAESGQTYVLNEARGRIERHGFSVHPVSIEITGRTKRMYRVPGQTWGWGEISVRVRVHFADGEDGYNLGELIYSSMNNEGRLQNIHHYYNLDYRVRPRIEDVEEFGE